MPNTPAHENRWHPFLEMAVTVARASGGAIWTIEESRPRLLTQLRLGAQPLDEIHEQWPGHVQSLQAVIDSQQRKTLDAQFEQPGGTQSLTLLLLPILIESKVELILELFLGKPCELPADQIESSVRQLLTWASPVQTSGGETNALEFANWLSQVYRHLDLSACCSAIVNETRTWSDWDRVSLLVKEGSRFKLKSVSGVDVLDPRSSTVATLERIANQLGDVTGLLLSTRENPVPELRDYLERVAPDRVALSPLRGTIDKESSELLGLVVFDLFEGSNRNVRATSDLEIVTQHIALALEHALRYESLMLGPLRRISRPFRTNRFLRTCSLLVMLIASVLVLCFYESTLTITGTGSLEPVVQRDIFAASNGLIAKLHVSQGDLVAAGQLLVTLRSPELEFETKRLEGELLTVGQQISDLDKLRNDPRRASELRQPVSELVVRIEELKIVESNLVNQISLLKQQAEELLLRSPMAGEVITWNVETLLAEDRPVSRTDRLLSIADFTGEWKAEYHVEQRDIGPVIDSFKSGRVSSTFLTSDAPEFPKSAILSEVAPVVTTDAIQGTTLVFEARLPRSEIPEARPGTTLLFRIDCRDAPIGYIWFRKFIDSLHRWWNLL